MFATLATLTRFALGTLAGALAGLVPAVSTCYLLGYLCGLPVPVVATVATAVYLTAALPVWQAAMGE